MGARWCRRGPGARTKPPAQSSAARTGPERAQLPRGARLGPRPARSAELVDAIRGPTCSRVERGAQWETPVPTATLVRHRPLSALPFLSVQTRRGGEGKYIISPELPSQTRTWWDLKSK